MIYSFYIQIKNGACFGHPIAVENFRLAYPHVDLEALPDWVVPFERIPKPDAQFLEVVEELGYTINAGIARDTWVVRPMTEDEKTQHLAKIRATMVACNRSTWTIDMETGDFVCPVNRPRDGNNYEWDDVNVQWVQVS